MRDEQPLPVFPPLFSLIVSTSGRTVELNRLLTSLTEQTFKNFEVIISDQNEDDRIKPVLKRFRDRLSIQTIRSRGGASAGRNAGATIAQGSIFAFPDDDCWYPPHLLAEMKILFDQNPQWDIATCRAVDEYLMNSKIRWLNVAAPITRKNHLHTIIEFTTFVRVRALERIGLFDETIGAGAPTPWNSGEITDLALRAITAGLSLHYSPHLHIFHPQRARDYGKKERQLRYKYSLGLGRVMRRHGFSFLESSKLFVRPIVAAMIFLLAGHVSLALYYLRLAEGRFMGWLGGSESVEQKRIPSFVAPRGCLAGRR